MTPQHLEECARVIWRRFQRYLRADAQHVLLEAARRAVADYGELPRRKVKGTWKPNGIWGFEVPAAAPLVFEPTEWRRMRLQPDLACQMSWREPEHELVRQNVVLRVWALDRRTFYREEYDSPAMGLERVVRRVMLRFHFDLADSSQDGPLFHLQVGGTTQEDEKCWLHPQICIPRLAHPPMDLVLAVEIVVANFLLDARRELNDPAWRMLQLRSQAEIQAGYYQNCMRAVDDEKSLLSQLWATGW